MRNQPKSVIKMFLKLVLEFVMVLKKKYFDIELLYCIVISLF